MQGSEYLHLENLAGAGDRRCYIDEWVVVDSIQRGSGLGVKLSEIRVNLPPRSENDTLRGRSTIFIVFSIRIETANRGII